MKLNRVLGVEVGHDPMPAQMDSAPVESAPTMSTAQAESLGTSEPASDEDDTLSYFAKLAKES